jgi:hypothetical protein
VAFAEEPSPYRRPESGQGDARCKISRYSNGLQNADRCVPRLTCRLDVSCRSERVTGNVTYKPMAEGRFACWREPGSWQDPSAFSSSPSSRYRVCRICAFASDDRCSWYICLSKEIFRYSPFLGNGQPQPYRLSPMLGADVLLLSSMSE